MSKSVIYTALTTDTDVAVGEVIPLGTTIRRYGCNLIQSGNVINIMGRGYYNFDVSITAAATAAGPITATVYYNGVPVPGATATVTAAATGTVNLMITGVVRTLCDCADQLTVVLSGTAATITNMAVDVEKM